MKGGVGTKKQNKSTIPERIEQTLDLPTGALVTTSRLELAGNRRVMIEGCRGVVEYAEDRICLRVAEGILRLMGRDLCMNCLNPACTVITGRVLSLEFL